MFIDPQNIRAELEQYTWRRATWTDEKLIACSPFRDDHTPSFYVYLRDTPTASAGNWGDSGTGDRGNFIRLCALLRRVSEEEAREYLTYQYGTDTLTGENTAPLALDVAGILRQIDRPQPKPLDMALLDRYKFRHPYLGRRGISEPVQRMMRVGYCREKRAVTIPWFDPNGELAALMYRKVSGKAFWYERGGLPLRGLIYGIDVVYRKKLRSVVLVEAPIDAMYIMSAGFPAVALGGANFSAEKADVLKRSPLREIIVMADHDDAGQAWKREAVKVLCGYMTVKVAGFPSRYKDVNDISDVSEVTWYLEKAREVTVNWEKLLMESLSKYVDNCNIRFAGSQTKKAGAGQLTRDSLPSRRLPFVQVVDMAI